MFSGGRAKVAEARRDAVTLRVVPPPVAPMRERRRVPRVSGPTVSTGPQNLVINHANTLLICSNDGSVVPDGGRRLGLFADDTRFLSEYEIRVNGRSLRTIGTARLSFRHARWLYVAPPIESATGDVQQTTVTVTLDRVLSARRMHEDIVVRSYGRDPVSVIVTVFLRSDFADMFEVRTERWQARANLTTTWEAPNRLETKYTRLDFVRRCLVRVAGDRKGVGYANGALRLPVDIAPGDEWRTCLQYDLITHAKVRPNVAPCPVQTRVHDRAERLRERWHRTVSRVRKGDPRLIAAFQQSVEDFAALRLYDHDFSPDVWLPAAGIPWFVAPFGRDSIIASLQALPVHPLFAVGTLQKLAAWQATEDDPVRDAEPGKIPHELRVGEWAHFGVTPHSPYYGTADATPLYLLLLGSAFRWLGDARMLRRFRTTAIRCLEWIQRYGDLDGDGFQEYRPRTSSGYRNQCWRDAEDGVLDEDGNFPPHPIGTCEMQAYVFAAKRGVSRLFDAWGDHQLAQELRESADALQRHFVDSWWLNDEGTVAFALDGEKRAVRTATANPGQCLWLGILDYDRGQRVADRLMRRDLFTGWGLRTLSETHPSYDPHSYQRGSVWPHDTMLTAAGLRRYGRLEDCWQIIDALLNAAVRFERAQMPELFAGLPRGPGDVPMPYENANVPQAWSAGVAFHIVRVLLGLEPDIPARCVYVDPALPPWCPELELENIRVGRDRISVRAWRRPDGSSEASVESGQGRLKVIRGPAPWMAVAPPR
jgi:glycogen debranching enzyme